MRSTVHPPVACPLIATSPSYPSRSCPVTLWHLSRVGSSGRAAPWRRERWRVQHPAGLLGGVRRSRCCTTPCPGCRSTASPRPWTLSGGWLRRWPAVSGFGGGFWLRAES